MSTTDLFAELLVIGLGVVIWLVLLIASVLDYPLANIVGNINALMLAPILGVAYVLGIVIDRLSFGLFRSLEKRNRDKVITPSATSPTPGDRERHVLTNSQVLRDQIIYNRSRLRICRSWIVNFVLIALSSTLAAYSLTQYSLLFLSLLSAVFALLTFLTWYRLSEDYYRNLQASYDYLIEKDADRESGTV